MANQMRHRRTKNFEFGPTDNNVYFNVFTYLEKHRNNRTKNGHDYDTYVPFIKIRCHGNSKVADIIYTDTTGEIYFDYYHFQPTVVDDNKELDAMLTKLINRFYSNTESK